MRHAHCAELQTIPFMEIANLNTLIVNGILKPDGWDSHTRRTMGCESPGEEKIMALGVHH